MLSVSHQHRTQWKPAEVWLSAGLWSARATLLPSDPPGPRSDSLLESSPSSSPLSAQGKSYLGDFSPSILLWSFWKPQHVIGRARISTTWILPFTSHCTCFIRPFSMVLRTLTSLLRGTFPLASGSASSQDPSQKDLDPSGLTHRIALDRKTLLCPQ